MLPLMSGENNNRQHSQKHVAIPILLIEMEARTWAGTKSRGRNYLHSTEVNMISADKKDRTS